MHIHKMYDTDTTIIPNNRNLWTVHKAFSPETLQDFKNLVISHDAVWHRPPGCLEYRLQLHRDSKFYPRLWEIAEACRPTMEHVVNQNLSTAEAKVWLDLPYFHCPYHYDNPELLVTMQLYLWSYGDGITGTTFDHNEPIIELPFIENEGYINYNIDQKIHNVHRIRGSRLSVAFQYVARSDTQSEM
jgi:hypothetical protein